MLNSTPRALLGAASRIASNLKTPNADVLSVVVPLTASCQNKHACVSRMQHFCTSSSTPPPRRGYFTTSLRAAAAAFTAISGAIVVHTALSPAPKPQQHTHQHQDASSSSTQDATSIAAVSEEGSAESSDAGLLQADPDDQEQSSMDAKLAGPWHTDAEMQLHLHRRALADHRLRGYIHLKEHELQNWLAQMDRAGVKITPEAFEHHMLELEKEVNMQTSLILYQVPSPTARRDYLAQYGCSKWSEEALDVIRKYSPIIEIGAGLGHWERELSARGANVLAVDNRSALPLPDVRIRKPTFVGKVVHGDESLVSKNPKHTLLLVYPGPDDMAYKALQRYKGDTLLYVGEARGGVNANPAFFDALEKDWDCTEVHPVEPFPNGLEKLWVLKRKGASNKRGWIW
ncbi:hypothetical protein DUNSADRAFT_11687 [Dunaliella salina]|uniref:Uncharacterized protein n=1 Tax=Dunaliella salina TaxID=3046 RepID=A0ABQ7H4E0_DUNSA|nr:hypothetical protein DUNSADRAFT_11687 [Dunaliella salina]|eukprot:KAF5841713.1 hypothetical protein DUNSADRAFT_11687 [Dunaliella salina]